MTLQVDAYDTFGHKTSASPVTWTILADTAPPSIAPVVLSPVKAGDVYTTGDVVTFTVTAADNVAVAAIRLTIDGVTTPFVASPAVLAWTAPNVSGSTPYTLDVEALDVAGNRSTASRTLSVVPAGGGTFPAVSFTCPTAGAFLPSAYAGLLLSAAATDAGGVTKIEFFRPGDVTPFSTSTATGAPVSYTGTSAAVTMPTVASDTVVRYRARAWNPSNHFTEVFVDVHVVPAVDFASATATDFAVLRSGTVVVDAPKTFAGLIVLRGATITHTAATGPGGEHATNLTVSGPMYVECGASVDVSGRGYGSTTTYPGATSGADWAGGSHVGASGNNGVVAERDDVRERHPAAGGGRRSSGGRSGRRDRARDGRDADGGRRDPGERSAFEPRRRRRVGVGDGDGAGWSRDDRGAGRRAAVRGGRRRGDRGGVRERERQRADEPAGAGRCGPERERERWSGNACSSRGRARRSGT